MVLGNSFKNTGHNLNECTNKNNKFKNKMRYYQKSIYAKNKQIYELKKQLINKQKCQVIFNNSLLKTQIRLMNMKKKSMAI